MYPWRIVVNIAETILEVVSERKAMRVPHSLNVEISLDTTPSVDAIYHERVKSEGERHSLSLLSI